MVDASKTYIYVFDNYIAQLVDGVDAGAHKHGAYQLSISLDREVHMVGPSPDLGRPGLGHLTAPNTPHSLHSCSGQQLLFWIAPESTLGRHLGSTHLDDSGFGVLPVDVIDELPITELQPALSEGWSGRDVGLICDEILDLLAHEPLSRSSDLHPALRESIEIIHSQPQFAISADDLANRVGLSTSRLLHLFKDQMGTPLRPHLQWLRLTDAIRRVVEGSSITDAAAASGFADASHLNRSAQQYFGLRPSDFVDHPDISIELCLTAGV
jgi:AraC-like DNA-binding protein